VIDVCEKVENVCTNVDSSTKWSAAYLKQEMEIALLKVSLYLPRPWFTLCYVKTVNLKETLSVLFIAQEIYP
jgi:hypothetical protein